MIKLIVAINNNNTIGHNGSIPWYSKSDLRHFKETTKNHIVIMGKNTFKSIDYIPLEYRYNMVLTRNKTPLDIKIEMEYSNLQYFSNLDDALWKCVDYNKQMSHITKDVFIIGGSMLYEQALEKDIVDEIIISKIDNDIDGDTKFVFNDENYKIYKSVSYNEDILKRIIYYRRKK